MTEIGAGGVGVACCANEDAAQHVAAIKSLQTFGARRDLILMIVSVVDGHFLQRSAIEAGVVD
jgi:hypothetical protein